MKHRKLWTLAVIVIVLGLITALVHTPTPSEQRRRINGLTGSTVTGTAYFVSPDGGVSTTTPSAGQCASNQGQSTIRSVHFTTIQAGVRCLSGGGDLVINAQNAAGATVPYGDTGFGMGGGMPTIPNGSAGAPTRIVGRCNADVASGNLTFTRTSCKPKIEPTAAQWGLVGATNHQNIFSFQASNAWITIDNLETSGANIGRDGSGNWDGTACGCYKGYIARVDYPSHDITFRNIRNTWMEAGFYLYAAQVNGATNVTITGYTATKVGWGYQTSHLFRCGDGCPSNSPAPGDLNANYWAHIHSIDIRSSSNTVTDSIFDSTSGSEQLFNQSYTQSSNTIERNLFVNGGLKANAAGCGPNACVGLVWSSNTGGTFRNNAYVNMAGLHITLSSGLDVSNNSIVRNSTSSIGHEIFAYYVSALKFRNNALCYNRDAAGSAIDRVNTFDGTTSASFNTNTVPAYGFSLVAGNQWGGCNATTTFAGLTTSTPGPASGTYGTTVITPPAVTDLALHASSALLSGGVTGGPPTDMLGTTRTGSPWSIGAFEGAGIPATTTTSSTTTSSTTTTTTGVPTTSPPVTGGCVRFEAEAMTPGGTGAANATSQAGYSGTGYRDFGNSGGFLDWANTTFGSTFSITFGYSATANTSRGYYIDYGSYPFRTTVAFPSTAGAWGTVTIVAPRSAGSHNHSISFDAGIDGAVPIKFDYADICDTSPVTTTVPGTTTTSTSTTTTTSPGATTTATGRRLITIVTFLDRNLDGLRSVGEGPLAGAIWRIRTATGTTITGGIISGTGTATAAVGVGPGLLLTITPPIGQGATTATVWPLPPSGPYTVAIGGCCPRRLAR